jgi:hypothetical protein
VQPDDPAEADAVANNIRMFSIKLSGFSKSNEHII